MSLKAVILLFIMRSESSSHHIFSHKFFERRQRLAWWIFQHKGDKPFLLHFIKMVHRFEQFRISLKKCKQQVFLVVFRFKFSVVKMVNQEIVEQYSPYRNSYSPNGQQSSILGLKIYLISVGGKIQDDPIRLMAMNNTVRA